MPQILNTLIFKLKPLLCVLLGVYAFISSYPGSFTASHSHAQQQVDCKTINDTKVISWTGSCVDGFLDGDGELVYESIVDGKMIVWKLVGKFYGGGVLGLYFMHNLTSSKGFFMSTSENLLLYANQLKINDNILSSRWLDEQNQSVLISFDEAWAKAEAATEKSKYKSIDPHLLKEYLAGRFKFNKADLQAGTGSPNLADSANAADDPQVFGGSSSPKAIKKKKK